MTESALGPLINTTKGYLQVAKAKLLRDQRTRHMAAYGLELLTRLLDELGADLAAAETAEVAVVYDILADQVAELLDLPVPDAFRALVQLCDDEDARQLVRGQPHPAPEQLAQLDRWLLWVTVTYRAPPDGPYQRVIEITYTADHAARSRNVTHTFGWEDLPTRVRERAVVTNDHTVRYQLYPALTGP